MKPESQWGNRRCRPCVGQRTVWMGRGVRIWGLVPLCVRWIISISLTHAHVHETSHQLCLSLLCSLLPPFIFSLSPIFSNTHRILSSQHQRRPSGMLFFSIPTPAPTSYSCIHILRFLPLASKGEKSLSLTKAGPAICAHDHPLLKDSSGISLSFSTNTVLLAYKHVPVFPFLKIILILCLPSWSLSASSQSWLTQPLLIHFPLAL